MVNRSISLSDKNKKISKTFLYTKGKEYSLNGVEYVGYYHTDYGVAYSYPTPSADSRRLYPYRIDKSVLTYDRIKPDYLNLATFIEPYYAPPIITSQQYQAGRTVRYFLKKRNENIIFEINKDMSKRMGAQSGFDNIMYQLVRMEWMVSANGITNELLAFNARSLAVADKEMPGLKSKVNSLFEYSVVDVI